MRYIYHIRFVSFEQNYTKHLCHEAFYSLMDYNLWRKHLPKSIDSYLHHV